MKKMRCIEEIEALQEKMVELRMAGDDQLRLVVSDISRSKIALTGCHACMAATYGCRATVVASRPWPGRS